MRTLNPEQWLTCHPDDRARMEAWFAAHGADWQLTALLIERPCGVTMLNLVDVDVITTPVWPKRPVTVLSEAPFPWPRFLLAA